ncbi:GNAT family N-acetyltransferase [Occultella glacieicola]|nr:GNAT family N-acetyltransferase [Occultella glacieicola]
MSLRWSTLDTDSVPAWAELTNLLAKVDRTEEYYEAEDLAEELGEPGFDPALDSIAVWDGDTLVAYSQLRVSLALTYEGTARAMIGGGVHPDWRGRGIATRMFDEMEPRGRALAAERHPGEPFELRASGGLESDPVRPLLTGRGYEIVRYFTAMQRPLPGDPLPEVTDPRVVPVTEELAEPLRLAHNEAFASHWGSAPQEPEQWAKGMEARSLRPATSRAAVADGEVLAYVITGQWVDRELYISIVGTRPSARGQGLARQVLTASLRAAVATGEYDLVELDVDSINPTGAGRLYESVGFTPVRTTATFAKVDRTD